LVVPWTEFISALGKVQSIRGGDVERNAMKASIDILENDHVSWFEFDIFTMLFQPWHRLVENWNAIVIAHPAYQAFLTYDDAEAILKKLIKKPGRLVKILPFSI
jgi:E3 ubiquitin-protein ligase CBL